MKKSKCNKCGITLCSNCQNIEKLKNQCEFDCWIEKINEENIPEFCEEGEENCLSCGI
jgi:hypothetical protein